MSDTRYSTGERVQSRKHPHRKGTVIDIDDHVPAERIPTLYVVNFGSHIGQYEEQQLDPFRTAEEEAAERFHHLGLVIEALLLTIQRKEPMRTTSSVTDTDFPFDREDVPLILVVPGPGGEENTKEGRGFEHASHPGKKAELVEKAIELTGQGVPVNLLACWPGGTRTDVFLVDDLDAAAAALA